MNIKNTRLCHDRVKHIDTSDTIDTIDTICYNIPIKSKEDVLCFFVKVKPQS